MGCFCKLHSSDLSNRAQGRMSTMKQISFGTSCKHLWRLLSAVFSLRCFALSASFLLIIFVTQETVCQSRANTALPKDGADLKHTGAAAAVFLNFFFSAQMYTFGHLLRILHVVWGSVRCMEEDERVQISSGNMTFEAESLGGHVRASVLKSPG